MQTLFNSTLYTSLFILLILCMHTQSSLTGLGPSTTEVAYHLKYFEKYYQLRDEAEQKLNAIEDAALLKLDKLRLHQREDLAEVLNDRLYEQLNDANEQIDRLFESVDRDVVLTGEEYDLARAGTSDKAALVKNALSQLLGTVEQRVNETIISAWDN